MPVPGHGFLGSRPCYSLIAAALEAMERELVEVRSTPPLAEHPWPSGKRLRPVTFLLSSHSIRPERSDLKRDVRESRIAAALELLHEASLIHDDLVDGSVTRRGAPTLHAAGGEALALLTGDYLAARAMKLLLDAATSAEDVRIARRFADVGVELARGEISQLDRQPSTSDQGGAPTLRAYLAVVAAKTAGFFAACAEGGAAWAGAGARMREPYRRFGHNLGMVFQMLDDLADTVGDPVCARKTLRSDLAQGALTLPLAHAQSLYPTHPLVRAWRAGGSLSDGERGQLCALLRAPEVLRACRLTAQPYVRAARRSLSRTPDNVYRAGLADLLAYVLECPWAGMGAVLSPEQAAPS